MNPYRQRQAISAVLMLATSCGFGVSREQQDGDPQSDPGSGQNARVEAGCTFPSSPQIILDGEGLVLKVWRFPLAEVHLGPGLPDEPAYLTYRTTVAAEGADARYPTLHLPPARDDAEAGIWRDENFNNELAYLAGVGSIEPITCLDALLFAEQNARIAQLEQPTEFLASVLRKRIAGQDVVVVVFGAGSEMFPPPSVHGFAIVDEYVAAGWRYWYQLHNHTRQADGALGVPVPSTSDVSLVRSLAAHRGLERVRVTNGFYTFDSSVAELTRLRARWPPRRLTDALDKAVWDSLGSQMYHVATTAYEGHAAQPSVSGRPAWDIRQSLHPSIELEELMAETGMQHAIISLRGLPAAHWLRNPSSPGRSTHARTGAGLEPPCGRLPAHADHGAVHTRTAVTRHVAMNRVPILQSEVSL